MIWSRVGHEWFPLISQQLYRFRAVVSIQCCGPGRIEERLLVTRNPVLPVLQLDVTRSAPRRKAGASRTIRLVSASIDIGPRRRSIRPSLVIWRRCDDICLVNLWLYGATQRQPNQTGGFGWQPGHVQRLASPFHSSVHAANGFSPRQQPVAAAQPLGIKWK